MFTYFNRLTCAPEYHSTSDAPCTLKIASCEAKLPHNTHLLRLSFWRLPTSGTGNSLTDIKVFSIHVYLSLLAPFILVLAYIQQWVFLVFVVVLLQPWLSLDASFKGNPSNDYHKNTLLFYTYDSDVSLQIVSHSHSPLHIFLLPDH